MSLMLNRVHSAGREGGQPWGGKIGDQVRRKAKVVVVGGHSVHFGVNWLCK